MLNLGVRRTQRQKQMGNRREKEVAEGKPYQNRTKIEFKLMKIFSRFVSIRSIPFVHLLCERELERREKKEWGGNKRI